MSKGQTCYLTALWLSDWDVEPQTFISHDSLFLWWHTNLSAAWTGQLCSCLSCLRQNTLQGTYSELKINICGDWAGNTLVAWLGEQTTSRHLFTFHSCPTAEGMLAILCLSEERILSMFLLLLLSLFFPPSPSALPLYFLIAVVTRNKTGLDFYVTSLHSPHSLMIPSSYESI